MDMACFFFTKQNKILNVIPLFSCPLFVSPEPAILFDKENNLLHLILLVIYFDQNNDQSKQPSPLEQREMAIMEANKYRFGCQQLAYFDLCQWNTVARVNIFWRSRARVRIWDDWKLDRLANGQFCLVRVQQI